ncbi:hypothetical protein BOX15_Mlig011085g3, partial [Macrostomum lignano]
PGFTLLRDHGNGTVECQPCRCSAAGSEAGSACDPLTGKCRCRARVRGANCDSCRIGYRNFPLCEPCACDTRGSKVFPKFPNGLCIQNSPKPCICKPNAVGPRCQRCRPGFWDLSSDNPEGCQSCNCTAEGVAGELADCDLETGRCTCKPLAVGSGCSRCPSGSRDLAAGRWLGCLPCGCDTAGSLGPNCVAAPDGVGSVCACLNDSVAGRLCDRPASEHFWPGLGQHRIELETSARIPSSPADAPNGANGTAPQLRYAFNATQFPGFSYLGYVPLDKPQPAVELELATVSPGPGPQRLAIRYLAAGFQPAGANDTAAGFALRVSAVGGRQLASVPVGAPADAGAASTATVELPDAGNLTLRLELADPDGRLAQEALLIDWLELTPAELLTGQACAAVSPPPCPSSAANDFVVCSEFELPMLDDKFRLESSAEQRSLTADSEVVLALSVTRPGGRFLLLDFVSDGPGGHTVVLRVGDNSLEFQLPACPNSKPCRHPAKRSSAPDLPAELALKAADTEIRLQLLSGPGLSLRAVYTIPLSRWSPRMLESRIARYRLPDVAGTGRPRAAIAPAWEAPQAAAGQPRPVADGGQPPPPPPPPGQPLELSAGAAATVSLRFADSADSAAPTRYRAFAMVRQKGSGFADRLPVLNVTLTAPTTESVRSSVALQFCAAEAGCPVDIGEMLRLPGINEVTAEIRAEGDATLLLFSAFLTTSEAPLPQSPVRLGATFRQDCLLADELEVRRSDPLCSRCLQQASVTYNKGYRPCQCHPQGALNKTCDPLSGQCSCRGITVGRTCDRCPIGYFSFPECKKCDCPGGLLCSEPDGECICPRNVAGKKCDRCEPGNYGYNVVTGCMPCRCNSLGTTNGSAACDLVTGQCSCGENIAGQKCSHCKRGHFAFPSCEKCNCTSEGVTEEICSAESGACACKENVAPPTCSRCKAGFFNLDPANPSGCTACFCSGLPNATCTEAAARMVTQSVKRLVQPLPSGSSAPSQQLNDVLFSHPAGSNFDSSANLLIPVERLTNETVRLYLGRLRLSMRLEFDGAPAAAELDSFLTLWTNQGGSLRHRIVQAGRTPGQELRVELLLHESSFTNQNGSAMSRLQFLNFLARMRRISWPMAVVGNVRAVRLQDASLELAEVSDASSAAGRPVRGVERCACPKEFSGLSCQLPGRGFFIDTSGGRDVSQLTIKPCACSNRSELCDPFSGQCLNCRDGFYGKKCEVCPPGHVIETGSDRKTICRPCRCPGPAVSNSSQCPHFLNSALQRYPRCPRNFAERCEALGSDMDICTCKEGYDGVNCERCKPGYYGDPARNLPCQPCPCSGNILMEPGSCHNITGECLRCQNSTGYYCELCTDWMFGDSVDAKNCTGCACDRNGTVKCNRRTGECLCRQGVSGARCSECEPDRWGFGSAGGCRDCGCGNASLSSQCDRDTGLCQCRPGVTGDKCDRCLPGYYGYGPDGCTECTSCIGANFAGCDNVTGQCQCVDGVRGERCDICRRGWLNTPQGGCKVCDSCIFMLIDSTDSANSSLQRLRADQAAVLNGSELERLLVRIDSELQQFDAEAATLASEGGRDVGLGPVQEKLDQLRKRQEAEDAQTLALMKDQNDTRDQAEEALTSLQSLQNSSQLMDADATDFLRQLEASKSRGDAFVSQPDYLEATQLLAKKTEDFWTRKNRVLIPVKDRHNSTLSQEQAMKSRLAEVQARISAGAAEAGSQSLGISYASSYLTAALNLTGAAMDGAGAADVRLLQLGTEITALSTAAEGDAAEVRRLQVNAGDANDRLNASLEWLTNLSESTELDGLRARVYKAHGELRDLSRSSAIVGVQLALRRSRREAAAAMNLEEARRAVEAKVQDMQNVDVFAKVVLQPLLSAPGYPLLQTSGSMAVASKKTAERATFLANMARAALLEIDNSTRLRLDAINNSDWARVAEKQVQAVADKVREKSLQINELNSRALQFRQPKFSTEADAVVTELGETADSAQVRLTELQQANSSRVRQEDIRAKLVGLEASREEIRADSEAIKRRKAKASTDLRLNDDKLLELRDNLKAMRRALRPSGNSSAGPPSLTDQLRGLRQRLDELRRQINSTRLSLRSLADRVNSLEYVRQFGRNDSLTLPVEDVADLATLNQLKISFIPAEQSGVLAVLADVRAGKVGYFSSVHVLDGRLAFAGSNASLQTLQSLRLRPGVAYSATVRRYRRTLAVSVRDSATGRYHSGRFGLPNAEQFPELSPFSTSLHLGGLPPNLAALFPAEQLQQWSGFAGIILKASLNGEPLNLWQFTARTGVKLHQVAGPIPGQAARYYLDGDTWATISEAFGSSAVKFLSDERLELALATHSPDSALLRPGAASARGSHGLIELRTESGRLVVIVTTPSSTGETRNVIRLSSRDRIDDGSERSVLLEMKNRKLRLSVDGQTQEEQEFEPTTFYNEFILAPEPEDASSFRPRFIGTIAGLAFNGNESLDIRFFGNSSRAVNSSRDSLLSRFVKVGGDSLLELPLGPGSLSSSGDAVEVSAGVLVRRLEGVIMKLRDDSQRKNLTVFFHNGILSLGQEYINNDKVVQDVLSQFIGMSESKFYNLIFRFSPGEVSLELNGIRRNRMISRNINLQSLQLGGGFQGCVKDLVVGDTLIHLRSLLRVVAGGSAVQFESCGSADADGHVGGAGTGGDVRVLDGCGRGRLPARRNFAGAVLYRSALGGFTRLGEPSSSFASFRFSFRATSGVGVLLNFDNLMDNLILFLHGGRLFVYNDIQKSYCRSGRDFGDGRWHRLEFSSALGGISVDNQTMNCSITSSFYSVIPNYFRVTLGGLPSDLLANRRDSIAKDLQTFSGCIRDVAFLNEAGRQIKQKASVQVNTSSCSEDIEEGVGFQASDIARSLYSISKVSVQPRTRVRLMLKPRLSTGTVLGLLDSTSDVQRALTVHLRDGDIVISVQEDGNVLNEVRAAMPSSFLLCDGDWHTVVAEVDFRRVRVWVDDRLSVIGALPQQLKGFDCAPFLGGLPTNDIASRLNYLPGNYVGCLKSLSINGEALPLASFHTSNPELVLKSSCFVN